MARIRTLKPELWLSPQVMNLAHSARLLFIGLITQADDDGRGSADARRLKASIFPGDDVTAAEVSGWLVQVVEQKLAVTYDGGEHGMLFMIPSWRLHQNIDRPRASRYPPFDNGSPKARRIVGEGSAKAREGSDLILSEGSEGSLTRARARPAIEGGPRAIGEAAETWVKGAA